MVRKASGEETVEWDEPISYRVISFGLLSLTYLGTLHVAKQSSMNQTALDPFPASNSHRHHLAKMEGVSQNGCPAGSIFHAVATEMPLRSSLNHLELSGHSVYGVQNISVPIGFAFNTQALFIRVGLNSKVTWFIFLASLLITVIWTCACCSLCVCSLSQGSLRDSILIKPKRQHVGPVCEEKRMRLSLSLCMRQRGVCDFISPLGPVKDR